ncbi:hypothetical protein ABK040_012156 [Willaertia magna]
MSKKQSSSQEDELEEIDYYCKNLSALSKLQPAFQVYKELAEKRREITKALSEAQEREKTSIKNSTSTGILDITKIPKPKRKGRPPKSTKPKQEKKHLSSSSEEDEPVKIVNSSESEQSEKEVMFDSDGEDSDDLKIAKKGESKTKKLKKTKTLKTEKPQKTALTLKNRNNKTLSSSNNSINNASNDMEDDSDCDNKPKQTKQRKKKEKEVIPESDNESDTPSIKPQVSIPSNIPQRNTRVPYFNPLTYPPKDPIIDQQNIDDNFYIYNFLSPARIVKNSLLSANTSRRTRNQSKFCYQTFPYIPQQSLYCPKDEGSTMLSREEEFIAVQLSKIEATNSDIRTQRMLRSVLATDMETFEKDYKFLSSKRSKNKTIPPNSVFKPYMPRSKCEKLIRLSLKELKNLGLKHGDLLHVPFSPAEEKIINYLIDNGWSSSKIATLFDGRIADDVKLFWDENQKDRQYSRVIMFYEKPEVVPVKKSLLTFKKGRLSNVSMNQFNNINKIERSLSGNSDLESNLTYRQAWKNVNSLNKTKCENIISGMSVELTFNKDSSKLALCSTETEPNAFLFDLENGKRIELKGNNGTVTDIKFTNDNQIATSCFDKAIRLYDATTGNLNLTIEKSDTKEGHNEIVSLLGIHPEESNFIVSSSENEYSVKFWDTKSGTLLLDLLNSHPFDNIKRRISEIYFGTNHTKNYFYGMNIRLDDRTGEVLIWDVEDMMVKPITRILTPNMGTETFSISKLGNKVAVGGTNGSVHVYDSRNGKIMIGNNNSILYHKGNINNVQWSADDTFLASTGTDGLIVVVDVRYPTKPLNVFKHNLIPNVNEIQGSCICSWSNRRGTSLLATSGDDGAINLYSVASGDPLVATFNDHDYASTIARFSYDDMSLATGSDSASIYLYSLQSPPFGIY